MKIDQLVDKNCRVAIVGNGGSLRNSKKGTTIDAYDVVIRFNNFRSGGDYVHDVGCKVNIWCNTFCDDIIDRDFDKILCPLPLNISKWVTRYSSTSIKNLKKHASHTAFIPEEIFSAVVNIHDTPSTGLCLVYWMLESGYKLKRQDLFGFDHFNPSYDHHYFNDHSRCTHTTSEQETFNILFNEC